MSDEIYRKYSSESKLRALEDRIDMTKAAVVKADSYDTEIVEQGMQDVLAHLGAWRSR